MPLLAPLADFAQVSRASTITAWIMGHGIALMLAPTSVVLVGGLAIAKVGYNTYLRFVWPLLLALFIVSTLIIGAAETFQRGCARVPGGVAPRCRGYSEPQLMPIWNSTVSRLVNFPLSQPKTGSSAVVTGASSIPK